MSRYKKYAMKLILLQYSISGFVTELISLIVTSCQQPHSEAGGNWLSAATSYILISFLARLFSKKRSKYCHSPVVVGGVVGVVGVVVVGVQKNLDIF